MAISDPCDTINERNGGLIPAFFARFLCASKCWRLGKRIGLRARILGGYFDYFARIRPFFTRSNILDVAYASQVSSILGTVEFRNFSRCG